MPTLTQVPAPWPVIRLAAKMGTPYLGGHVSAGRWIGTWFDWLCSRPKVILHWSPTVRLTAEGIAGLALLIGIGAAVLAAFQFRLELENREEDRVNRAWSLVAAAKEVEGNVGLIEALETLNSREIDLSSLQAPKAYLRGISLPGVQLSEANLSGADLSEADLSGASLSGANLSEAKLFVAWLIVPRFRGHRFTRS